MKLYNVIAFLIFIVLFTGCKKETDITDFPKERTPYNTVSGVMHFTDVTLTFHSRTTSSSVKYSGQKLMVEYNLDYITVWYRDVYTGGPLNAPWKSFTKKRQDNFINGNRVLYRGSTVYMFMYYFKYDENPGTGFTFTVPIIENDTYTIEGALTDKEHTYYVTLKHSGY